MKMNVNLMSTYIQLPKAIHNQGPSLTKLITSDIMSLLALILATSTQLIFPCTALLTLAPVTNTHIYIHVQEIYELHPFIGIFLHF